MEKARIVVIEDRESNAKLLKMFAEVSGHTVVEHAATLPQALDTLNSLAQRISTGEINPPDVYALDGNLEGGRTDCHDAHRIYSRMQELGLPGKIVGYGANPLREYGIPTDHESLKDAGSVMDYISTL